MSEVTIVARGAPAPLAATRWRRVGAVLALVAAGGFGLVLVAGRNAADVEAAATLDGTPPAAYTIDYRTQYADAPPHDERLEVVRPLRSHVTDGTIERVSDLGWLATGSAGSAWLRMEVPIAPAVGDIRPLVVLDGAPDGVFERRGTRTVAGRECQLLRFGGPVSSGVLTPVGTAPGEYADVCIDADGLVLAETWVIDGDEVRSRVATAVSEGPVDPDRFSLPDHVTELSPDDGGGAVAPVDATADPGFAEYWRPGAVPAGFHPLGRWAVVPPRVGEMQPPGAGRASDVALITDVWTRGADLLVIDQGATRNGAAAPWDDRPVIDHVELGDLGAASVVWDLRMSEVRVLRPDGGFVRVAGTLRPHDLVDVARHLYLDSGGAP